MSPVNTWLEKGNNLSDKMQNQAPFPQMQGQPSPQVIYILTAPPTSKVYENYAAKTSRVLGITRIIIGALSIVFQIARMLVGDIFNTLSFIGTGIWCGIMFIIAGSFGVGAASSRTFCMIMTNMVLAIVSLCLFGTCYLGLSVLYVLSIDLEYLENSETYLALYYVAFVLALGEVVCEIWSAVICCKAICCGRPAGNMNSQVIHSQGQVYRTQQLQKGYSVAYNPQPQPTYNDQLQVSVVPSLAPSVLTTSGNTTPPPPYTQEELKQQPQGFAV